MDGLIVYPDGTDKPGVEIPTHNGFVSRVVGSIADDNIPDAERAAAILNEYFATKARSIRQLETERDSLVALLAEIRDWLDGQIDVVDGDDGQPKPNAAMSFAGEIDALIGEYT